MVTAAQIGAAGSVLSGLGAVAGSFSKPKDKSFKEWRKRYDYLRSQGLSAMAAAGSPGAVPLQAYTEGGALAEAAKGAGGAMRDWATQKARLDLENARLSNEGKRIENSQALMDYQVSAANLNRARTDQIKAQMAAALQAKAPQDRSAMKEINRWVKVIENRPGWPKQHYYHLNPELNAEMPEWWAFQAYMGANPENIMRGSIDQRDAINRWIMNYLQQYVPEVRPNVPPGGGIPRLREWR